MSAPKEAARTALHDAQERVIRAAFKWRGYPEIFTSRELVRAIDDLLALGERQAKDWPEGLR